MNEICNKISYDFCHLLQSHIMHPRSTSSSHVKSHKEQTLWNMKYNKYHFHFPHPFYLGIVRQFRDIKKAFKLLLTP